MNGIPAELRVRPQWVARAADKKPYCAPGRLASSTDPSTWLTFDGAVALAAREGLPGVGFVFAPDDPYTGIDLDKCRDAATGTIQPWAQRLIERLNSYTEVSPSGTGLHVFVRAVLPGQGRKRSGPEGGAIETYDRARYFTVTGVHVAGTPQIVEDRQPIVADLYGRLLGPDDAPAPKPISLTLTPEDHVLIEEIAASKEGPAFHRLYIAGETRQNRTGSENDLELAVILAQHARGDVARVERLMRASPLRRDKWDRRGDDYLARTIRVACRRAGVMAQDASKPSEPLPPLSRTLAEIVANPDALKPPEFVVPGLAWRGRLTVFAAPDKAGKSTLVAAGVAALKEGGRFLGEGCAAGAVLWAMLEEHVSDLAIRATAFGTDPERLNVMEHPRDPIADLRIRAKELRPALIVVDTLVRYAGARVTEGGSSAQWTTVMVELQNLARELNCAVLVLHHSRRSDGEARDSGEITARADVILEQKERHGESGLQRIEVRARWAMPTLCVKATLDEHGKVLGYERVNDGEEAAVREEGAIDAVCAWLEQQGHTTETLAVTRSSVKGLRGTDARGALDAAIKRGRIRTKPGRYNKGEVVWLAEQPESDLPF